MFNSLVNMANTSKSVKLFNLEERKNQTGSVTEVDIYQWKNTLIDNLSKEPEFKDHCKDTSRWNVEKVPNRGFTDENQGDGTAEKKANQVQSMLTKIASYAPKTIVREIIRRTKSLSDIWNIAKEWAGIQTSGAKHYYKTKMSFQKVNTEETRQEFFYRLRDAMEDTLIMRGDNITDDGEDVKVDEDMTPTVKSIVVLDWLDAIGGPALVEHVHRVYAKELESVTLSTLQSRIWTNMDVLLREAEGNDEDPGKVFQVDTLYGTQGIHLRQVSSSGFRGRGSSQKFRGQSNQRFQSNKQSNLRGRRQGSRGTGDRRGGFQKRLSNSFYCKLCKANGSPNYLSHDISDCWLLDENDRSKITQNFAKAQALFTNNDEEVNDDEEEFPLHLKKFRDNFEKKTLARKIS